MLLLRRSPVRSLSRSASLRLNPTACWMRKLLKSRYLVYCSNLLSAAAAASIECSLNRRASLR